MKNKKIKWLIIGVVLVVIILIAVMGTRTSVSVQTDKARSGTIRSYVEDRARTTLPRVYRITMPFNGRVEPIILQEGSPVKKGEVVARLDTDNLETELTQYNEVVEAFEKSVQSAMVRVGASKTVEEYSKWVYEAVKTLYPDKLVSEQDVKESAKDSVEDQATSMEDQLTYYAMTALNSAIKLLPIFVKRDLDRSTLTSPIDGVVLKRYVENEIVLNVGQPLLDIGDPAALEVTADILTEAAGAISPGDQVEIFGSAVGNASITGTVKRIFPEGFTKVSSLGVEQQRVKVKIAIDPGDLKKLRESGRNFGVEYRVRVRIFTAEKAQAVIVPRTALFRGPDGEWEVFAVKVGKARLVKVKLGLTNDREAEVVEGISSGDTVILAPATTLTDGARVKAENSG
jgi:HlyD family secretion protein